MNGWFLASAWFAGFSFGWFLALFLQSTGL